MASGEPTSLQVDIHIDVPVEKAFQVFTERFDEIKPHDHNLLAVPIERTILEPFVGGAIRDVGTDGSSCAWARVLTFDPPRRIVFSWDISPRWRLEPDPRRASEVEVRFVPEGPERTHVVLEHRLLDRHGEGWQSFLRLDNGDGWPLYLDRFTAAARRERRETA